MTGFVDGQLIEGLRLPYEAGATAALSGANLKPAFAIAGHGLLDTFAHPNLRPVFDELPIAEPADLVAFRIRSAQRPV